jgi:uncharacterized protein with FMN-binding domain
MRRAPFVLGATAAGLVAVLSFRTHDLAAVTTTPSALHARASVSPSGSSTTTTDPSTTDSSPSTSATTSTTAVSGTATGTAEQTRYGVVQVRVTVAAGRITDISTLQLTADDVHSEEINAAAAPQLRQEALSAQSAHIDGVSGATFTSDGYEASLQSALDKIGFDG